MDEIIKDIRQRCRMAMNGVASASMRNQGLSYKLNFGVSIQKIKEISLRYQPDKNLAETLWLDTTRELKILATFLYPISDFSDSIANVWVTQIPNQEIREQVCLNLFQKLPYADTIAHSWANNNLEETRTTGYWLYSRRMISKKIETIIDLDSISFIWEDILSDNISLSNSATLFLKQIVRLSENQAEIILKKIIKLKTSKKAQEKEVFDSLAFEFDFYHSKE